MQTQNEDETLAAAEQPAVTKDTKFRRGGFKPAAELIAEAEGKTEAEVTEEQYADPLMAAAILEDAENSFAPPAEEEAEEGEQEEAPAEEEGVPEQPGEKYRLGGREFQTQEEAWAYAEELEQEKVANDAFRQGIEAAQRLAPSNPAPTQVTPEAPKEIDPLYYSDPLAYHAKLKAEIVSETKKTIKQEQQAEGTKKQIWDKFYSDYPDLAPVHEMVALTFNESFRSLEHVEVTQAMKQIAEKTRAKLKPYLDARLPKVALPKVTNAVSPGGSAQVTQPKTAPKTLNFAQQMKNLKRSRAPIR